MVAINEVECLEGVGIIDNSLLSGNKFNLMQTIEFKRNEGITASVAAMVPYSSGQLIDAKIEMLDTLGEIREELNNQGKYVACLVMDKGTTNPKLRELRALRYDVLPCVAHVMCNTIKSIALARTVTLNHINAQPRDINVAQLKRRMNMDYVVGADAIRRALLLGARWQTGNHHDVQHTLIVASWW